MQLKMTPSKNLTRMAQVISRVQLWLELEQIKKIDKMARFRKNLNFFPKKSCFFTTFFKVNNMKLFK